MRAFLLFLSILILPAPALAQSADETAIRGVIATWYAELQKQQPDDDTWRLHAPGFIDGGPFPTELRPQSAARSPTLSNELAARALRFAYDVDLLKVEGSLAKVIVWERGYFYAFAAETSYENAARAIFVLEKQREGDWKILAHAANSEGIPPNRITSPLPDMKPLWEARQKTLLRTPGVQ